MTNTNSQQFSKKNAVIDRIEGLGEVEKHSTTKLSVFHLFNNNVIYGVISSAASFNSRALILSSPVALLAFRDLSCEATKSSSTGRMRKLVVSFDSR